MIINFKEQILKAVNRLRQEPLSLAGQIQSWRAQFISDRIYKHSGKLYKLKQDKSILQQALQFLKKAPLRQPLVLSEQLSHIAVQRAALLADQLKLKSHHASSTALSNFGQCSAVLADQDQLAFLLLRLICDDGVPHRSNRRVLLQSEISELGVGVCRSKEGYIGVTLLMSMIQNHKSCLIRFLSTLFCQRSYLTLMNLSSGNSSLQPDSLLILFICSLNYQGYIWLRRIFLRAKFQTKMSYILRSKSSLDSSALRSCRLTVWICTLASQSSLMRVAWSSCSCALILSTS